MLGFFPKPLPDEMLYSVFARYHRLLDYQSFRETTTDLFGRYFVSASFDLPSHIRALVARLPWDDLNEDLLIRHHTAFPYYASVLSELSKKRLFEAQAGDPPPAAPAVLGSMASTVKLPEYLRFCPDCCQCDQHTCGEAYWHRVHQLPGVIFCPIHNQVLWQSNIQRIHRRTRHAYISLTQALVQPSYSIEYDEQYIPLYVAIAHESERLLRDTSCTLEIDKLRIRFCAHLKSLAWISRNGSVRASTVKRLWQTRYPERFRQTLVCGVDAIEDPVRYLRPLMSDSRGSVHPLLAVLIWGLADTDISHLLNDETPQRSLKIDFGEVCINSVCRDFGSARSVKIEANKKNDSHVVHCEQCGTTFTRSDITKGIRYLDRGALWKQKLKELMGAMLPLREIARQLRVDPQTVKKHADKEHLPTRWRSISARQKKGCSNAISRANQRTLWLELRASNPSATRRELRQFSPAVWAWLYRNDHEWLLSHQPKRARRKATAGNGINWSERDRCLSQELNRCACTIRELPGRPVRITRAEIARQLGDSHLFSPKIIKHLPKVAEAVEYLVESPAEYAKRRILWCTERYKEEGYFPRRWQIEKRSGLRRELAIQCQSTLDQALEILAQGCNEIRESK